MHWDLKLAITAPIVMNLALAFYGRGSMGQIFFVILVIWLVPVFLGLAALTFVMYRISPRFRRATGGLVLAGLLAGTSVFSLPLGLALNRYDVNRAKAYCDSLRPAIERHKTDTGRYPKQPPGTSPDSVPPRLLRGKDFYYPQVDDYMFAFSDSMDVFDMIVYDSRTGEWRVDED